MKISISFLRLTFILSLWCCIFCVNAIAGEVSAKIDDSKSVLARFVDPPREYSSGPLWVWNDMLSEREVLDSLRDLAGQHIRQAFVHPRPGLMTPYLSPEWFRLWKAALVEAEKLDMNLWIYDENSYPSGFAGGFVPEEMPESQSKSLQYRWEKQAPKLDDNVLGAFLFSEKNFKNATANIKVGEIMPQGKYLVFFVKPSQKTPWLANRFYVDLLRHGVAEKFLDITLNAYQRHFGDQFGKRIPGSFTDEPNLNSSGGLPWSDGLADEFQKRWGYSLLDNLPALVQPQGDWKRVRHDFYQLLLEQFIENWAKPYHDRCKKYALEFTGHYWDHAWPNCLDVPDNMAMYAWSQRPAIDCLMNQYSESVNAQFGNLRMVKELSSVANQLGRKRTLCETYGAAGWELRFEDMKRIGDWLFALGVNTMDEHLSYITIRGSRKRDHPQSFSYHEPWWEAYHVMVDYFTRLSAALSSGEEINHILVVEPTTTAWLYQADRSRKKHLDRLGRQFQRLVVDLSKNQVEYDIGCENIIARHGSVDGAKLIVGRRAYSTLVLPPMTETLNATTMELLEKYAAAGGKVFCCGEPPALVDGRTSVRGKTAALNPGWKKIQAADLADSLLANDSDGLLLRSDKEDRGILYHLRRRLPDGELLFLVNTSIHSPTSGTIQTRLKSVSQWDAMSGKVKDYPAIAVTDGLKSEFDLPPCGSLLLFFSEQPRQTAAVKKTAATKISALASPRINRLGPNVLTLDYVDIAAGGKTEKNIYFYLANQFAFRQNGLHRDPWDSAVQFRDEIISKKFPPDSGFTATYRFTIEGQPPKPLEIVIERPDLYAITCNGFPQSAVKNAWWLDKSFGKIDISAALQEGVNTVSIQAKPMSVFHELESAYLLGDFNLKATDSGFHIEKSMPLKLGPWNKQGHPFYATGVSYTQKYSLTKINGQYYVKLPAWYGSVAKVNVNGKLAGYITHQPWQCEVGPLLIPGKNTIEVIVFGTLRNTLGPHHAGDRLGSVWPASFQSAPKCGPPPAAKYFSIGYGLFQPFVLEQLE